MQFISFIRARIPDIQKGGVPVISLELLAGESQGIVYRIGASMS